MMRPDSPCAWCGTELPVPLDVVQGAWGDLWLSFSLVWGPRPQHDFNGALCRTCGSLLLHYVVDPAWRETMQEACRQAEEHGFDPVAVYLRLKAAQGGL